MPAASGAGGGGGGSAHDVRAGGAFYELTGKDKLGPVLDKAEDKVKEFSKTVKAHASVEGSLGKLLNLAGSGGALGLGIGSVLEAGKALKTAFFDAVSGAAEFQSVLEQSAKAAAEIGARIADAGTAARDAAGLLTTREGKGGALTAGIKEQQRILEELLIQQRAAEARVKELEGFNGTLRLTGNLDTRRSAAAENLKAITAEIDKARAAMKSLTSERDKFFDIRGDVNRLREAMNLAVAPKFEGFVGQVKELERQLGSKAPRGLFGVLLKDAEIADAAVKINAATDALKAHVQAQRQAQMEFGKTADEIALMRAELAGVDKELIENARRELGSGSTLAGILGAVLPALGNLAGQGNRLSGLFDSVKSGFNTASARQQFGIGDKPNDVPKLLAALNDGNCALPQEIASRLRRELEPLLTAK